MHNFNTSRDLHRAADGAFVVGSVVFGTIVTALLAASEILVGIPALLIGAASVVLIPTARHLSGRVFVNSVLLCAATYLVWMIPAPAIGITRGGLLLSLLVGGVCGTLAASHRGLLRGRIRPAVAATDIAMAVLATLTSITSLTYWFKARTPELAYGLLSATWDNSSHYSMVVAMHRHQNIIFNLGPAADQTPRSFASYPAGYHSVAASIMDVLTGSPVTDPGLLPVAFVMTVGIVLAAGYFIVAAGIAGLPIVRRAGAWGYFAISAGLGVLGFGPGIIAPGDGHYNFSFAVVMVLAAGLAATGLRRVFSMLQACTILAAILCAGGAWLPMGVLAAGLSLVGVFPWRRSRWIGTAVERIVVISTALIVLIVTLITISWQYEGGTTVGYLATVGGGLTAVSAVLPPLTAALLAMLGLVVRTPAGQICKRPSVRRASLTSALLAVLIVAYFVIESVVVTQAGQSRPSYYPQKALNGITIVGMVIGSVMIAIVAADRVPLPGARAVTRRAVAATMCVIGIVPLAMSHTMTFSQEGLGDIPGRVFGAIAPRPDLAAACQASLEVPDQQVAIIVTGRETDTLICAVDRGTSSWGTSDINQATKTLTGDPLVQAARPWLDDGSAVLVVAPESLDEYRQLLGAGSDDKVIAWQDPGTHGAVVQHNR